MNIITDINNVVVFAGKETLTRNNLDTRIGIGSSQIVMSSYNLENSNYFEIPDEDIPEMVVQRYCYTEELGFYKNPQFNNMIEESHKSLLDATLISPFSVANYTNKVETIKQMIALKNKEFDDALKTLTSPNENLSVEQIEKKKEAQKIIAKLKARYRIEAEVGDIYDLLADARTEVNYLTGMLLRLILFVIEDVPIPEQTLAGYLEHAYGFINAVDNNEYKDRSDLEDPRVKIPKLMGGNIKIANIIADYKEELNQINSQ